MEVISGDGMTKVYISDEVLRKYAMETLEMVDKTWTPTFDEYLKKEAVENPEKILDMIDVDVIAEYARGCLDLYDENDIDNDWYNLVDEEAIIEYATSNLDMVDVDDLADNLDNYVDSSVILDYVQNNYEPSDVYDNGTMESDFLDKFLEEWPGYVGDEAIMDYAREDLDMMTEDEAIEFAKDKLDG